MPRSTINPQLLPDAASGLSVCGRGISIWILRTREGVATPLQGVTTPLQGGRALDQFSFLALDQFCKLQRNEREGRARVLSGLGLRVSG